MNGILPTHNLDYFVYAITLGMKRKSRLIDAERNKNHPKGIRYSLGTETLIRFLRGLAIIKRDRVGLYSVSCVDVSSQKSLQLPTTSGAASILKPKLFLP